MEDSNGDEAAIPYEDEKFISWIETTVAACALTRA